MHTHKTFIKTYLGYPTKTEQFVSFKKFGDEVMNLEHAHDRGILTGEKNVRNLEQKLSKVVHVYLYIFVLSLCVSALENHLLTKGCSHFLVASYTLSLLQVYFEPATLLNRAATTPGTLCPTLFDKCVGSLTSHGILELKEL